MDGFLLEVWRYALVVFGIGLVIFVHELGHFLAARWCGVRVETFSLGFGPKLLGWTRGATTYQVAAVPLGGFVRMAGEEVAEGRPPLPDELPSKTVGQRFLIYSGGVIMNVVFALIVFPIILTVGVPFAAPVLGPSAPGSPAWHAGLAPGTRVESVNGNPVYGFINIPTEVALGSPEEARLVVRDPGSDAPRNVRLIPEWNEALGAFSIGAMPAADPDGTIEVQRDSPAARAGLRAGDRLVAVPDATPGLTLEEQLAQVSRGGQPVRGRFLRDGAEFEAVVQPEPDPRNETRLLGVGPPYRTVLAVRDTPLAHGTGLQKEDRVLSVNDVPCLRPFDLLAGLEVPAPSVRWRVLRHGSPLEFESPALAPGQAVDLFHDIALALDQDTNQVVITPGSAAADAGLRDGDRIVRIGGAEVAGFADILAAAKSAGDGAALALEVERPGERLTLEVAPRPWRAPSYGLGIRDAQYLFQADGALDAIRVGFALSWKFLEESWLTLKRILFRQVSGQNIGGIITIGVVSHSFASVGLAKLFYFLCMLSMNLAFLNVLPIPVLDGGHLMFLLIERVKGSPVSERVHGYSQLVGVVLIVSLMVYVTFNDVVRWIVR